jgi:aspartyl-tRNA(Asn)/glutamyl-tRNA(Gln) amidotransferase subunit A
MEPWKGDRNISFFRPSGALSNPSLSRGSLRSPRAIFFRPSGAAVSGLNGIDMNNDDELTITKLAPLIRRKKISPVEITNFLLERIERLQPEINAYITVTPEIAISQARQAEREIARGKYRGALHGIPISVKDLFYTSGIRTTAGSRILKSFVPKENASAVDVLFESGCVLLGKTNLHEFANGATNVNPHYGPVHNPWNLSHISGGSSGGSAASVVTAQALASLGTDTGGSIRIPSAACGCVGFKPTYGRVSLSGAIPLAWSLDHAGPLTRCVMDAALMFEALAGPNPWHPHSGGAALAMIRKSVSGFKIGVPKQYFFRVQPGVRKAVLAAIEVFKQLGAQICEVQLEGMEETNPIGADITAGEALAYHAKWLDRKAQLYGEDLRARMAQTRNMTAIAYVQAQRKRQEYAERMERALSSVQLMLAPTLPITAPRIDQSEVMIGRRLHDIRSTLLSLTRPANLSGQPAISVPCGFAEELPVGLQIIGRRNDDLTVLRAAYAYEQATPWHKSFVR